MQLLFQEQIFEHMRRFIPQHFTQEGELYAPHLNRWWRRLLKLVKSEKNWESKLRILDYLVDRTKSLQSFPSSHFSPFHQGPYKRCLIGLEKTLGESGYESLIIQWEEGAITPTHGHPPFSYYKVIDGVFRMNFYELDNAGKLIHKGDRIFRQGDSIHSLGKDLHYSNFIHDVECLKEGKTFHLYSGNARKGKVFQNQKTLHA